MKRETYPNRASNHTYIVCLVSFGTGIPQSTDAREIEKSLNPLLIQPWTYKLCLHETDWRTCIFLNNKNKHIQKARLICNKATQPPRLCCNWKPKYWMFRSKIWDLNICWFRYWLQFLICHCKFCNPLFAINVSIAKHITSRNKISPHSSDVMALQNQDFLPGALPTYAGIWTRQRNSCLLFLLHKASNAQGSYCFRPALFHPASSWNQALLQVQIMKIRSIHLSVLCASVHGIM